MKTGFITIIGRANVGKSTLLNSIIGEKIAIISDKPQTTRNRITGIYNTPDAQLVFVDTPGIHTPKNKLGEHMVREAREALDDVDCILFVVEPRTPGRTEINLLDSFRRNGDTVILVINKVDKFPKAEVAKAIADYAKLYDFRSVVPISAMNQDGVNIIVEELFKIIEDGGMCYYPDDIATDQTVRQMASEIIREKILRNMYDEVPHGIAVEPIIFKERENKAGESVTDIVVNIICEREAHKGMLIGKNGAMLKKMASQARIDLENLVGGKVYLECHVKVKENWRDSEKVIAELQLYDN